MQAAVLVTGGAGYIGSHACKALAAAGFLPVTLDCLDRGHRELVQFGPLIEARISDRDAVQSALQRYQPVGVLHFAALAYVGESVAEPLRYYQNNVAETLVLLETLRQHGALPLVFSSTCATYGNPQFLPISEAHPQIPINPYGRSKLMIEQVLRDLSASTGLRSVALRYFNAVGADPGGQIGELHDPETHLLPLLLQAALGQRDGIDLLGDDWPTADGTCIRDYIHVDDLATAHVAALHALLRGDRLLPAYNLGTGTGYSVKQVIAACERISGTSIRTTVCARRAGDPAELVADARAAHRDLGWSAQCSDLQQIVADAWAWHQQVQRRTQLGAVGG
jgi:UDP-glucose-4-epimerase GalE